MKFVINHTPKNGGGEFCVRLTGDIRRDAKRISLLFPGEVITVWALSRGRLTVQNGEVITDNHYIDVFYDLTDNPHARDIRHQWEALIGGVDDPGAMV